MMTEERLTNRLARYLLDKCPDYIAVYRTGDKGQCVHISPIGESRMPTLCGIDRTDNGNGVERYRAYGQSRKYFGKGAWMRVRATRKTSPFEGTNQIVYLGNPWGWMPQDRHLCQTCMRKLPRR